MYTFRASCCSTRLSVPLSRTGNKKGEGVRGDCLHWRVQGSTGSPTGIGSRWNLECPVGLSQREIYAHFNEGKIKNCGFT